MQLDTMSKAFLKLDLLCITKWFAQAASDPTLAVVPTLYERVIQCVDNKPISPRSTVDLDYPIHVFVCNCGVLTNSSR